MLLIALSESLVYLIFLSFIVSPSSGNIPKFAFIGWKSLFGVDIYFANAPIIVLSLNVVLVSVGRSLNFSTSFSDADIVVITDIYAAREVDDGSISAKDLVDLLRKNKVNATHISKFEDIAKFIKEKMEPNDLILTVGAGDITHLSDIL